MFGRSGEGIWERRISCEHGHWACRATKVQAFSSCVSAGYRMDIELDIFYALILRSGVLGRRDGLHGAQASVIAVQGSGYESDLKAIHAPRIEDRLGGHYAPVELMG